MCLKLTINTTELRYEVVVVFLLLTLNLFHTFFYSVSIFEFKQC